MLTDAEEDRLRSAIPLENVTIEAAGTTATYDFDTFWSGGDAAGDDATTQFDGEYPALVFGYNTQAEPETGRQPLNDLHEVDNPIDEPGMTETRAAELSDLLSLTVAVEATWRDGIPPQTRVRELARPVWKACRFDLSSDLNQEGQNGERPMRVELGGTPIGPERVARTLRVQWPIRIHYRETVDREHDTAAGVDYEVGLE